MATKKKAAAKKVAKKDEPVRLNMTFEEAIKKAANTPLPKKVKKKTK
ncbi:hypothetical protein [Ferruginibacter sp.]